MQNKRNLSSPKWVTCELQQETECDIWFFIYLITLSNAQVIAMNEWNEWWFGTNVEVILIHYKSLWWVGVGENFSKGSWYLGWELNQLNECEARILTNTPYTQGSALLCVMCRQKFSDDSNFKKHYRIYTWDCPYGLVCNKKFNTHDEQKQHHRRHTYVWHVENFLTKKLLNYPHQEYILEGSLVCVVSKKAFTHKVTLKRHYRQHTDAKPYLRQECSSFFFVAWSQ
jgi:hypothetical protein